MAVLQRRSTEHMSAQNMLLLYRSRRHVRFMPTPACGLSYHTLAAAPQAVDRAPAAVAAAAAALPELRARHQAWYAPLISSPVVCGSSNAQQTARQA